MKLTKYITILFLFAYIFLSGGAVVYSHFCSQGLCHGEVASLTKRSCCADKHNLKSEASCCPAAKSHCNHQESGQANKDCCEDEIDVLAINQVNVNIEQFTPITLFVLIQKFPSQIEQLNLVNNLWIDSFPRIPDQKLYRRYQRYLC